MKDDRNEREKTDSEEKNGKEPGKKGPGLFRRMGAWLELDLPKRLNRPLPFGMRIFKTGLATLAVFFFYLFVNRPENGILMAMIAAIVSLQDTVSRSFRVGVLRLIGTTLGGIFGIAFIYLMNLAGLAEAL